MITAVQWIVCRRCGRRMWARMVTLKRVLPTRKSTRICEQCFNRARKIWSATLASINARPEIRRRVSERMRRDNPSRRPNAKRRKDEDAKRKHEEAYIKTLLLLQRADNDQDSVAWQARRNRRMQEQNPMHNPETVRRVHATLRKKRESGLLATPSGPDHWLWRGNRTFNMAVRARMYLRWSIKVFARDNYTCTRCGATRCELHAHHVRPLRDIISQTLTQYGVSDIEAIRKEDPEAYSRLIDAVLNAHTADDGITLCKQCHGEVDTRYRRKSSAHEAA